MKIRESLLGSAGVGSFPVLSNRGMFWLDKQIYSIYTPTTYLELSRSRPLTLGNLMWHVSTQVNNSILAASIIVFDQSRGKLMRFITFLVYALLYTGITSNLVTFDTLSPWSDSV